MKIYEDVMVKRVAATVCDLYPPEKSRRKQETNAYATLTMDFGYGSSMDGILLELDLSERASQEILELLRAKYGVEKIDSHLKDYMP